MTVSCNDSNTIPKVPRAGEVFEEEQNSIQLMHNGLRILEGCYYGPWMTHIIEILKGHHEPQEELAFYEVLNQLKKQPSRWETPTILELGSFWAYYSMWFLSAIPGSRSFGIEPDPVYLEIGKQNFHLNNLKGVFLNAQVAAENDSKSVFNCESDGQSIIIPALNFPGLVETIGVREIDLVLVDIQGAETPLLTSLAQVLTTSKIRFILISTHDLEISGSPVTHQTALKLLIENGAHIISEHSVSESFSGDGFILASFFDEDKGLSVPISYNRSKNSLFGEWEPRLQTEFEKKDFEMPTSNILLEREFSLKITEAEEATMRKQHEIELELQHELKIVEEKEMEIIYLNSQLSTVLESKSWHVTKPLRTLANQIKKLRGR
jgi:FkbM family methyltransferase